MFSGSRLDRNEDAADSDRKVFERMEALFMGETKVRLELIIQQLEMKASQPSGIGWSQSSSPTSGSQPLEDSSDVIQLSSESISYENSLYEPVNL